MATVVATTGTQVVKLLGTNVVKAQNTIDFSVAAHQTGATSTDTVNLLKVPAGACVTRLVLRVDTPQTGTATIGDGDSATGWLSSINTSATAGTATFTHAYSGGSGAYPRLGGKYYASEDTIDMFTTSTAFTTGKITVAAEYSLIEG